MVAEDGGVKHFLLLSHGPTWYPEVMLRRLLIVALSMTAAGTGLLWILSYLPPADYDYLGEHAYLRSDELGWWMALGAIDVAGAVQVPSRYVFVKKGLASLHCHRFPKSDHGMRPFRFNLGRFCFSQKELTAGSSGPAEYLLVVRVPLWVPFTLLAAYPASAFVGGPVRRWRRRRHGLCPQCAYDLTGNVSEVCGEGVVPDDRTAR